MLNPEPSMLQKALRLKGSNTGKNSEFAIFDRSSYLKILRRPEPLSVVSAFGLRIPDLHYPKGPCTPNSIYFGPNVTI